MSDLPPIDYEPREKGIIVTVENPRAIFDKLCESPQDSTLVQDTDMSDKVCTGIHTDMRYYGPTSTYNPNYVSFNGEMHFEGRPLSGLSLARGYLNESQLSFLMDTLKTKGYTDVALDPYLEEQNSLTFNSDNIKYVIDLGFKSPTIHTDWMKARVEKEKAEGQVGYYTAHPELQNAPVNENIRISQFAGIRLSPELSKEDFFAFSQSVRSYAGVLEDSLNGLYDAFGQPKPDKELKITPTPNS